MLRPAGAAATTAERAPSPRGLFAVADETIARVMDSVISDADAAATTPVVLVMFLRTLNTPHTRLIWCP